jgi:hypothetical protein
MCFLTRGGQTLALTQIIIHAPGNRRVQRLSELHPAVRFVLVGSVSFFLPLLLLPARESGSRAIFFALSRTGALPG